MKPQEKFALNFLSAGFAICGFAFAYLSVLDDARVWDHGGPAIASFVFAGLVKALAEA